MYYTYEKISRKLYEWCLKENLADAGLIAKWKKPGYENLCSTFAINPRNFNFGSASICRVPKHELPPDKVVIAVHTGCLGCASGSGGYYNIFGNKFGQHLADIQHGRWRGRQLQVQGKDPTDFMEVMRRELEGTGTLSQGTHDAILDLDYGGGEGEDGGEDEEKGATGSGSAAGKGSAAWLAADEWDEAEFGAENTSARADGSSRAGDASTGAGSSSAAPAMPSKGYGPVPRRLKPKDVLVLDPTAGGRGGSSSGLGIGIGIGGSTVWASEEEEYLIDLIRGDTDLYPSTEGPSGPAAPPGRGGASHGGAGDFRPD